MKTEHMIGHECSAYAADYYRTSVTHHSRIRRRAAGRVHAQILAVAISG